MAEIFSKFIPLQGGNTDPKKPLVPWKNPNTGVDYKTAEATYSSYAGVMRDDVVCLDVDTNEKEPNKGLTTYKLIYNYIKSHNIKCRIMKTTKGWHFYFKRPESERNIGRHCPSILCCGAEVDYLVEGYCVLKLNGEKRKILQEVDELDELPVPLRLAVSDKERINKYQFYNAGHGERYTAISGFKLVLMKKQLNQEEIIECLTMACSLFGEKYDASKIRNICKITEKEANKIEEAIKIEKPQTHKKSKEETRAEFRDTIGHELVEKYKIKKLNGDSGQMYLIYPNKTYYEQVDFKGNKDVFNKILEETYPGVIIETKDIKEIKQHIDRYAEQVEGEDLDKYINVNNGYINVDTLQFTPINRDTAIITRHRINIDYNPDAYDEFTDKFFNDIATNKKGLRRILEELVGQCLIPKQEIKKLFILTGNGSNGKSTFINAIEGLIGGDNFSALGMEQITDVNGFFICQLYGMTANFGDDIGVELVIRQEVLKQITGGSVINANIKNKEPIKFVNNATLVFSCNEIPKFKNANSALNDRLFPIPFPAKFERDNNEVGKKLATKKAKEYLFLLGLQGLARTRKNSKIVESLDVIKLREQYLEDSDPIRKFLLSPLEDGGLDYNVNYFFETPWNEIKDRYFSFYSSFYGKEAQISVSGLRSRIISLIGAEPKLNNTRVNGKLIYTFIRPKKHTEPIVEKQEEEVEVKEKVEVDSTENDLIVYDFEVFKEDWIFGYLKNNKYSSIVNNREELEHFYNHNKKATWIGYNSNHYDIYILKGILNNFNPFEISQYIVNSKDVPVYKKFNFIDNLNELKSYDCGVKNGGILVGLKQLESNMGDSIEESEVDFNIDRKLTDAEISDVIKYNKHDVEETWKVFQKTKDTYNANKSIIDTFKLPQTDIKKTQAQLSAKVLNCQRPYEERTDSENISILDTIKIDKNKDVVKWYLDKKWTEKGAQLVKIINNVPHTFGIGGLHGAVETTIHEKGNILHIDVNSYYPSLMIKYNLLTRNSKQPNIYKEIYEKRLELKRQGKKKEQAPYKIILNATYGITKDKFSDAYDPRQGNMICINGQLALLDLIEKLENKCELIQSNTDGLIVSYKDNEEEIKSICKEWEDRLGITLGYDYIEEIWQKDANNYMIKYKNGEIECKGIDLADSTLQKNDAWIVKKAVREYLLNGTPVEETIGNVNNKLIDYQYTANFGKTYDACYYGDKKLNTKINRIFASSNDKDPTIYKLKNSKKEKADLIDCKLDIEGEAPNGAEKIANIPTHCFIDNGDINNKERTPNIDLNWYIKKAKEIIGRYDNKN